MAMFDSPKNTFLTVGFTIEATEALKLCKALDRAIEVNKGYFTFEHEGQCTVFYAPRILGVTPYRIARALLDGYKLAVLS